jgi:hypothetical protein
MSRVMLAAVPIFLLAACGGREPVSAPNGTVGAEADGPVNAGSSDPATEGASANLVGDPVPPPDAVSHPNGFLPPAPGEAEPAAANASAPEAPPPATEDEYTRNRQVGR